MKKIFIFGLGLLFCFALFAANAKDALDVQYIYNNDKIVLASGELGKISNASDEQENADKVLTALSRLDGYGFSDVFSELRLLRVQKTAVGKSYRFEQFYGDYKVFGRQIIVSVKKDGTISSVSGNYLKNIKIDIPNANNQIDIPNTNTQIGNTQIGNTKISNTQIGNNQNASIETAAQKGLSFANRTLEAKFPAPYYYNGLEIYSLDRPSVLCYSFTSDYRAGYNVFIDIFTGEIVSAIPLSSDAYVPSTGEIKPQIDYNGNTVNLPVEKVDAEDTYVLGDATRNIYMYDAQNAYDYSGELYKNASGSFDDSIAVTTYNNIIKSYDFYADPQNLGLSEGFLGADGKNDVIHDNAQQANELSISALVHFGEDFNNAAYVSGVANNVAVLIFGDGDRENFGNYGVALDVVGHEYQHIVTDYIVSGLIYQNASGALNEAISDVFGALIEGNDITDDNFWICGEDLTLYDGGLRNLKNPHRDRNPASVDDIYRQNFCFANDEHTDCDNGGVHANSTIIGHVAFNMYNNLPSFFTKEEMGTLWFNTLNSCFPTTNFEDFRILMLASAEELEYSSEAINAIKSAFDSAGINGEEGEHTITFFDSDSTSSNIHTITANYGDYFTMPDNSLSSEREGYTTLYWYDVLYAMPYYFGETYKMPAYDMILYPYLVPLPWAGFEPCEFDGSGTWNDPFLISTKEHLASLSHYVNTRKIAPNSNYFNYAHYKMTANINLAGVPWTPIGTDDDNAFCGYFDGNGHKISNIELTTEVLSYKGLFGVLSGEVKNLGIEGGAIEANSDYLGAIAAVIKIGSIIRCYNSADVIYTGASQNDTFVGGLAAMVMDGSINNCYNTGDVTGNIAGGIFARYISLSDEISNGVTPKVSVFGNNYNSGQILGRMAGGIAARSGNTYIVNCINTGRIAANTAFNGEKLLGGITARLNVTDSFSQSIASIKSAGVYGCRNTGHIDYTNADIYGGIVGKVRDNDQLTNTYASNNIFKTQAGLSGFGSDEGTKFIGNLPTASSNNIYEGDFDFDNYDYFHDFDRWEFFGGVSIFDGNADWHFSANSMPTLKQHKYWLDEYASSFGGGSGTEAAPYLIGSAEQLARLAHLVINEDDGEYARKAYKLTADIDLGGKIWVAIGAQAMSTFSDGAGYVFGTLRGFGGTFDGNGFTISNLSSRSIDIEIEPILEDYSETYLRTHTGFFAGIYNTSKTTSIKNLTLEGINNTATEIRTQDISGGLAAIIQSSADITNVEISSGAVASLGSSGAVAGLFRPVFDNTLNIENCKNNASIIGNRAGGFVGEAYPYQHNSKGALNIKMSLNNGKIELIETSSETPSGGGLIGYALLSAINIDNSIASGNIRCLESAAYFGGFIGAISHATSVFSSIASTDIFIKNSIFSGDFIIFSSVNQLGGRSTFLQSSSLGAAIGATIATQADTKSLNIKIEGCTFKTDADFIAEIQNLSLVDLVENNNTSDAQPSDLDFSDIDFLFSFLDGATPEAVNDYYEFLGNAPLIFSVTFKNLDGTVLLTIDVRYGCAAIFSGDNPEYTDPDGDYEFTFKEWDRNLDNITENTEITATYDQTEITTFEVTFKDYDGTVLAVRRVKEGETAVPPTSPTRENDEFYRYVFGGWNINYASITADTVITATYTRTLLNPDLKYTVIFVNFDGTVLSTQTVTHGEAAAAPDNPSRKEDIFSSYSFSGWDRQLADITGETTITATYDSIPQPPHYEQLIIIIAVYLAALFLLSLISSKLKKSNQKALAKKTK